jgi:hypothetical protein
MKPRIAALLAGVVLAAAGCATHPTPAAPPPAPVATLAPPTHAPEALAPDTPRDWRWVQGMVFVPTNAVNEAQQWDEYDPATNERELHYASVYGINVVRVYLHYYVYLKKKDVLLRDIEDFLTRANRYGIRTEFVFFDDCWNQPPQTLLSADYHYPAPIPGVHNSQWLVCPGDEVRAHYEQHRAGLQAYVQDIVNAHLADPRICFWEIYNEPNQSEETKRLEKDASVWIKQTGTKIPATATGKEFSGTPFSDFVSWHQYENYNQFGDWRTLCTECMNRKGQTVPGIVSHYKGKVGYIMWEFGIGRDNCRFAWDENRKTPRTTEAVTPFHGVVYPDGHPWALDDAKALLGDAYAGTPFFAVDYFRDEGFADRAKQSVVPVIDLSLGEERGTGSPDASAGVPVQHYSIQYEGEVQTADSGDYTFSAQADGIVSVKVGGKPVVDNAGHQLGSAAGKVKLAAHHNYHVVVRYVHATGRSTLQLNWEGPGLPNQLLTPITHPSGL